MRQVWKAAGAGLALTACAASPDALLHEARGAIAQTLCTKTFVSGLDPAAAYAEHLRREPGMGLIDWAVRTDVDRTRREVRVRIFGAERRAMFAEGRGCTLAYPGAEAPEELRPPPPATPALAPIADDDAPIVAEGALAAAIDAAFAEPGGAARNTKAVVIVHKGRIVGERYAPDVGVATALLGHSLSKSVVNALTGVLVRDGRLRVSDRAPIAAWRNDARGAVTIDNLLRMDAGFGFDEGGGASIATHIWFAEPDTARASSDAVLRGAPGSAWGYSSRSYVLLSRILADGIGGPQAFADFAHRELFGPLGMTDVTMEFDAAGTPMGANAFLATPRDWARFGLLYLRDGVAGDRRILPEGWVRYSATPTGSTGYGAGFWLNTTDAAIPEWRATFGIPGASADAFMARGYLGQYIVVVPSADLVVVRMGVSHARAAEIGSVGSMVRDAIAALRR